ncbi:hypothetical protein Goshw_000808 [Gossypium schwendimanii]|uniref:Uncharacterized protein n=1 Tax=Gossypium schwendimanii TaxID=34291 RepID=A0A7J9KPI2_GOSSC|nr:hypothetical protein [Gossypium schwendimanii]
MGNEVQSLQQQEMGDNPNNNSGFLPPSLVSDEIADTIKSFFPLGASSEGQPISWFRWVFCWVGTSPPTPSGDWKVPEIVCLE